MDDFIEEECHNSVCKSAVAMKEHYRQEMLHLSIIKKRAIKERSLLPRTSHQWQIIDYILRGKK